MSPYLRHGKAFNGSDEPEARPRPSRRASVVATDLLVEVLATFVDRGDDIEEQRHRQWARDARQALDPIAFPGGYPNFLVADEMARATKSYGRNAERLMRAKRHYD